MQTLIRPGRTASSPGLLLRTAAQSSRSLMTEERTMESYCIRIYRQGKDAVAGVIQPTEGAGAWAFRNLDELRDLLRSPLTAARGSAHLIDVRGPDEAGPAKQVGDDAVRLLHECLRALTTSVVDEPSRFPSAPGYYAVYFTDEAEGIKLEYVHVPGNGGDPCC